MDYYESAYGVRITRERALKELDRHGIVEPDRSEFDKTMGVRETYSAQKVLGWLGY